MYAFSVFISRIFMVTAFCAFALADITPEITFNCGSGVVSVSCDQSIAVYEQGGSIKFVDMLAASPVYDTAGSGSSPAIDLPYIVWDADVGGFDQIYVYDTASSQSIVLTDGSFDKSDPDISGERVVYRYKDSGDSLWHIAFTQIQWPLAGTTQNICTAAGGQYGPSIYGDTAAWYDKRDYAVSGRNIYGYDLSSSNEFEIFTQAGDQLYPQLGADIAVWQDNSNGVSDGDIYARRLPDGQPFVIAEGIANQTSPEIAGDMIIWLDSSPEQGGIYAYDLSSYSRYRVASGASMLAGISEQIISWYDGANINAATLPLQTPIQVIAPAASQSLIAGEQITIQWENEEPTTAVDLMFSDDLGQSWTVIASSLSGEESSYQWQLPESTVAMALIGISYSGQSQSIYCSGTFSIASCDPSLTADISGDCFVGLEDLGLLASQWMQSGL
jgi:beta propeller repeat protein